MGIAGRCLSRCSTSARSTRSTATSRRCSASRSTVARGRGGRHHRRQRRGQDHAAQDASPAPMRVAPRRYRVRRRADRRPACACSGRARHRAGAGRAAALSLAHGRGEPPHRRPARSSRAVDARAHLRAVPRAGGAPAQPSTSLSGGQQQMVAIGRALMSQPAAAAVRRDQPRPRADRGARDLCAPARDCGRGYCRSIIVEQDIVQALKAANHVYCLQEGRVALAGAAGH